MRKKSLIGLALISLVSFNTYALTITKGHLISHKEWSTGDIALNFKNLKPSSLSHKLALPKTGPNTSVTVVTWLPPISGAIGATIPISGLNELYVYNSSTSSQTYGYQFGICVNTTTHDSQCTYTDDQFSLDAGGYAKADDSPTISLSFDTPGTYQTSAVASVLANDNSEYTSNSSNIVQIS
jgi:hypothetical protein